MMSISLVVPVRNEARQLEALIAQLRGLGGETVVVDGESTDGTFEALQAAGMRVIQSPRGRARQMNAGAAASQGEILLFLHADTQLPTDALARIKTSIGRGYQWGRFDVRIEGGHFMLKVVGAMMNVRSRLTGIATGDQAIFVSRRAFEAVGGFPDQPLMEDIEISKRLRALGPAACLRDRVITSGRRWETQGVWRTIFLMWRLRWAYWRGVAAADLAALYR